MKELARKELTLTLLARNKLTLLYSKRTLGRDQQQETK